MSERNRLFRSRSPCAMDTRLNSGRLIRICKIDNTLSASRDDTVEAALIKVPLPIMVGTRTRLCRINGNF